MNRLPLKWLAQSTIYRDSIDLLAVIDHGGELVDFCQPANLEIKRVPRHEAVSEPTLALTPASARSLMQALWDAGIRPENLPATEPHITALKGHIGFAEKVATELLNRLPPPQPASQEPKG